MHLVFTDLTNTLQTENGSQDSTLPALIGLTYHLHQSSLSG